jgi:rhamnose utilization protein RhaD (predicted bifunctional aldolase and dehydrogenase)
MICYGLHMVLKSARKENMETNELLNDLTDLSREFGQSDYVFGGGGNTSAKNTDTLWIKPSGTSLAEMTPERFVAIDRKMLSALYSFTPPADTAERERVVKDMMMHARRPGSEARPSVETPLHDLIESVFVIHTHPSLVNGLTCSRDAATAAARLFPDALWVPYIDPGFTLSIDVRDRLASYKRQHGKQPIIILLQNHGIFVAGDTPAAVRATYRKVMDTLKGEYQTAVVSCSLPEASVPEPDSAKAESLKALLEAGAVAGGNMITVADGPLTPDHMVYAKAFPYSGDWSAAGISVYRKQYGYAPRIINSPAGVYTVGKDAKSAGLAWDAARDGALIRQLAAAFGGVRYLDDRARQFIENWEVESYREKQSQQSA